MTDDVDLSTVPGWVIKLVTDTAETRSDVKNLGLRFAEVAIHFDNLVGRREFAAHIEMVDQLEKTRIEPLWDSYQQLQGQAKQSKRWIAILATAVSLLGLVIAARAAGIHISF